MSPTSRSTIGSRGNRFFPSCGPPVWRSQRLRSVRSAESQGNSHHARISADIGRWTRINAHDIKRHNGKILIPLHRPQPLRTLLWRSVSGYSPNRFRTFLKGLNAFPGNWSAADSFGFGFRDRINCPARTQRMLDGPHTFGLTRLISVKTQKRFKVLCVSVW